MRGGVLVAASIVLGTAAHLWAAGAGEVRVGPLIVMAALLTFLVAGIVGAGRWLGSRVLRRAWADSLDDLAAAGSLLAGQAFVHAMGRPLPVGLPQPGSGHAGHGLPLAGAPAVHASLHGAHTGGSGMVAAHLCAALAVALMLRQLEACLLGLRTVLTTVGMTVHRSLGAAPRPAPVVVMPHEPVTTGAPPATATPRALSLLRAAVVRRGPPLGVAVL